MSRLTDEQLIKRSSHAGRNLTALALLASIFVVILILPLSLDGMFTTGGGLLISAIAIAVGYWLLAVAAKQGNTRSVNLVLALLGFQLAINAAVHLMAAVTRTSVPWLTTVALVVGLLIVLALNSSRRVLVEIRERGLWEQAFPIPRPTGRHCVVGGVLLVAGIVGLLGSSLHGALKVRTKVAEARQAQAFIAMISQEEQAFLRAMADASNQPSKTAIEAAIDRAHALQAKVESLKKDAAGVEPLAAILITYGDAVKEWQDALAIINSPQPDPDRAQELLINGDKLRAEAARAFDRRYVSR